MLCVTDDGAGVPQGFDPERDSKIGLTLVMNLARQQLCGRIDCSHERGLRWELRFRDVGFEARV